MKITCKICLLVFVSFCGMTTIAQNVNKGSLVDVNHPEIIYVDLFNPEDSVGLTVFGQLNNYEEFGHLGDIQSQRKSGETINQFAKLFDKNAIVPDDLSDTLINGKEVSIAEYKSLAQKSAYQKYVLITQKVDSLAAYKIDTSGYYFTTIKVFKLFSERAIIGETYKHAAIYTLGIRFRTDTMQAYITEVKLLEGDEKVKFKLGKYGRHIYSEVLVTNDLTQLAQEVPGPRVPVSQPSLSNFFFYGGKHFISFLGPESFRNQQSTYNAKSGVEDGWNFGVRYQKTFGAQDVFGFYLGAEYERNTYGFSHSELLFIYDSDQNDEPLVDLEGGNYDLKYVTLDGYSESGELNFIKPELGLFLNWKLPSINFQFFGGLGNSILFSSSYSSNVFMLNYEGEIVGQGSPIQQEELGFYIDRDDSFSGEHTEVQNFIFYKGGIALDVFLGQRFAFTFMGEYRGALTYVIRENRQEKAFLGIDTRSGFNSQLNMLTESRNYEGFALLGGFKIFLNEKR